MVKQVRIIGIVGDGQHYVGRGQGDDEAGWHAVQGGGIQCILGKKGVAGGGEQRYFGRNGQHDGEVGEQCYACGDGEDHCRRMTRS